MIYLLHYDKPVIIIKANGLVEVQHYLGWSKTTSTMIARMGHHRNQTSRCKFTIAMAQKGIDFVIARVLVDGERDEEARIKRQHNLTRFCPICNAAPRTPYELRDMTYKELADVNARTGRSFEDAARQILNTEMYEEQRLQMSDIYDPEVIRYDYAY